MDGRQIVLGTMISGPTDDQVFAAWPARAKAAAIGGSASLACTINVEGRLEACRVTSESAQGGGFGEAALSLARFYLFNPATRDGQPMPIQQGIGVTFACGTRCTPFQAPAGFTGPVVAVNWVAAPSAADVQTAYPAKAREAGRGGGVTLFCEFRGDGGLRACRPAAGAAQDADFVRAAVMLSARFKAPRQFPNGRAIAGAGVLLRVSFSPDPAAVLGVPSLGKVPTAEAFNAAYPAEALRAGARAGAGVVACTVADGGTLTDCALVGESPAGAGFGPAALALAPTFGATLWSLDGRPTLGARMRLPIRFDLSPPPPPTPPNPAPSPMAITNPDWRERPSPDVVDSLYPGKARAAGQRGVARLRCRVKVDGRLEDCVVAEAIPAGFGFGEAALRMAPSFQMSPRTVDGAPVGGAIVHVTIRFN